MSTDDALTNLLAITGVDATTGAFYLESAGGSLELAVQLFFANAGGGNGNSFSSSSSSASSSSTTTTTTTSTTSSIYNVEQLTSHPFPCYKIVEADNYGQYPFIYCIVGKSCCVVIDTGCGVGNLREFLDTNINQESKPYHVVLSHVHFDHIGGAFSFCTHDGSQLSPGVHGIYMSNMSMTFSKNIDLCSLCSTHGASIQRFHVSNWCKDRTRLWLDDDDHSSLDSVAQHAIDLLHTPGHSSDSMCIYSYGLNRLFVADR